MDFSHKEGLASAKIKADKLKSDITAIESENETLSRKIERESSNVEEAKEVLELNIKKIEELQKANRDLLELRDTALLELKKVDCEIDLLEGHTKAEIEEITLKLWSEQDREHLNVIERHEQRKKQLLVMQREKQQIAILEETIKARGTRILLLEHEISAASTQEAQDIRDLEAELRSFVKSLED